MNYWKILLVVLIFSLGNSSCSIFYRKLLSISDPSNKSFTELIALTNTTFISGRTVDYIVGVDDSSSRVQAFSSALIGDIVYYDREGDIRLDKDANLCIPDKIEQYAASIEKYTKKIDIKKRNTYHPEYFKYGTLDSLLLKIIPIDKSKNIDRNKITVVYYWGSFAQLNKSVELSKTIEQYYPDSLYNIIRLNCDLVDSKYKKFKSIVRKGEAKGLVKVDFTPIYESPASP